MACLLGELGARRDLKIMNKTKLQLILIISAFLLPAVIALLLQTRWFHWDPSTTRNRGELIQPVIDLRGDELSRQLLGNGHRWSVLFRVPAVCDSGCLRRFGLLARIREAQGKEMDRVQMLAWPAAQVPQAPWIVWRPDATMQAKLALPEGGVVLIDPLGNAMLRFAPNADPTDVRKDLAHLLRWSEVGK